MALPYDMANGLLCMHVLVSTDWRHPWPAHTATPSAASCVREHLVQRAMLLTGGASLPSSAVLACFSKSCCMPWHNLDLVTSDRVSIP
jgi:hypothetical protein